MGLAEEAVEKDPTGNRGGNEAGARTASRALSALVVVSGGVLMGVEIAGSRILAPGFGTSIYVWGSLIGLFMGAMSGGYYVGGLLADKRPSFPVLASIASLAGLYTFILIPYLGPWMCTGVARSIIHRAMGPLLASTLLFFVPSFLMAMVSPYAVKLMATSLSGLGSVAGRLYALSTAGSIVGTLLTTFILVPTFGVSNTLQGLGLGLLLFAVVCLVIFKKALGEMTTDDRNGAAMLALLGLVCIETWAIFPVPPYSSRGERVIVSAESTYHDIAVTEEVVSIWSGEDGKVYRPEYIRRWLKFNDNIESGIYPYQAEYKNAVGYTNLFHLARVWVDKPKRVLVVGGGGAIAPTQFNEWYGSKVDILELDREVQKVAEQHFEVKTSENLKFFIGDARLNLKKMEPGYDVVILDAYSSGGQIPFHLLTWEFLNEVKSKLSKDGVLVTNIISALKNLSPSGERPADLLLAEVKTLCAGKKEGRGAPQYTTDPNARMFKQVYVFPRVWPSQGTVRGRLDTSRNIICIASNEDTRRPLGDIVEASKKLLEGDAPEVKLSADDFVWHAERLYESGPTEEDLNDVPVLSDNFAPVDTMYRPVKRGEMMRPAY